MAGLDVLRRAGPLARFAALSAVALALVGTGLAVAWQRSAHEQAIAEHESALVAQLGGVRGPAPGALKAKLRPARARALTRALGDLASAQAGAVRLWNRDRKSVYTVGRRLGPPSPKIAASVPSALGGEVTSVTAPGWNGGQRLVTLVPYRPAPGSRPVAAFAVSRPLDAVLAGGGGGGPLSLPVILAALLAAWAALCGAAALALRSAGGTQKAGGAEVDPLTGLPNRTAFRDALQRAATAGKRSSGVLAVLVMDLDRFKEINDTLGHYNGDLLIKRIGPRLRAVLRDDDTIARLGGDEFALLLPDLPDNGAVAAATKRILDALEEPFVLGGLALRIEASIGVALCPEHGNRVDLLLHRADTAMYAAKTRRTGYAIYSEEQGQGSRRRLALASELRKAIADQEIVVHYEPKARLETGDVVGVEALARWEHPDRGTVFPGEFIPIAEQTNQLHALTERVLDRALCQLREWEDQGRGLTVAVNLSTRNLLDVGLPAQIGQLLKRWRVDPASLELEVTESMLMTDPKRATEVLVQLKELGVRLSVDDFGTGHSSLAYLKDLPVDTIKVDKSFVMTMDDEPRNAAIVRSTVDLGRNLGLSVVAEGVETQSAYKKLESLGCDYAQGYLLARAMPASEFSRWLDELDLARRRGEFDGGGGFDGSGGTNGSNGARGTNGSNGLHGATGHGGFDGAHALPPVPAGEPAA